MPGYKHVKTAKKSLFKFAALFFLFTLPCSFFPIPSLHAGVKYNPVVDLSLYGGQYYLDGDAAGFDWKFEAFVSPSVILNENDELYPLYMGYYNGTQDIQELAGGGVLTRQRQEHTISLKYVHISDFNKVKPRVSYSRALIQETRDESWGDGLFNYNTMSAGIELEQEKTCRRKAAVL